MDIRRSKPITLPEVKEILLNRKEDGELEYEQFQALEYIEKVDSAGKKEWSSAVLKELLGIGKISEETAIKLMEIKPQKPETVKAVLLKERIELSEEEISQIVTIINR
jgi:DNA-directed RNA polymerase subunit F